MDLLLQRIVDGLSDGSVYALVALALVMVYRTTGMINFAQGEMGMVCAFVAWWLLSSDQGLGMPMLPALLLGILAGFVLGAALERFVVRPFEGGDHLRLVMVGLGLFLILNALAGLVFSTATQRMESPFPKGVWRVGGAAISYHSIGLIVTLAVLSFLLWLLFTKTTVGVTLQAASVNGASASLLGINVNRSLLLGWALAGALSAIAAILVSPTLYLSTSMMLNPIMYGFAAAVVGGFDSSVGAVVGGLVMGLAQNLVGGYVPFIGTDLQIVTVFVVVLGVLLVRPQGLFGRVRLVRV